MADQKKNQPLLSGVIYGECAFWIALAGMTIGIIGIILYFIGMGQYFDSNILINQLLAGKDVDAIWKAASGNKVQYGHWYLSNLLRGDAIAMLGIAVCCFSAVVGAWGSVIGMIANKEKPYLFLFFALIIAVILLLSAAGLISIH